MRSHIHVPATYLKHFSRDPSKGRNSIVRVFNKKRQLKQDLPVNKIGIKKGAFSNDVEQFNKAFEDNHNKFVDLMSIRYPSNITEERLKDGMMIVFNLIFRNKFNYENIKRIFKNQPEVVEKYGEDPWHSSEVISHFFFKLIQKRPFPISIRGFIDEVFITGDNPVVIHRLPFGSVYFLPIDRKHIFYLGYYDRGEYLKFMEYFIKTFEFNYERINEWIRYKEEILYIV